MRDHKLKGRRPLSATRVSVKAASSSSCSRSRAAESSAWSSALRRFRSSFISWRLKYDVSLLAPYRLPDAMAPHW